MDLLEAWRKFQIIIKNNNNNNKNKNNNNEKPNKGVGGVFIIKNKDGKKSQNDISQMTFYSIESLVFYLQHHQTLCRPLIKEKHRKPCNVARSEKQSSLLDIM